MGAAKKEELGVVRKVRIADIVVPEGRKRSVRGIEELTASIAALGLLSPITLTRDGRLVAGLHRLRACESLGWTEIPALTLGLSELDAELAEIDENLCRTELTALERAEQTTRRKQIYEARHPETRRGVAGAQASNRNQGRGVTTATVAVASFVADTATKTGASARGIARDAQIAEGITSEVRDAIRDSPLADRVRELVDLARVEDPEQQAQVANLIVSGEATGVSAALAQLSGGGADDEEEASATPTVLCDELGQEITDPEIAESFTLVTDRIEAMATPLRAAIREWESPTHEELVEAGKLRVVESRGYMSTRTKAATDLPRYLSSLLREKPYALCPYCKGERLPKDRKKYCQGCGGGGWVDRHTYDTAPEEMRLPGTGWHPKKRRAAAASEVGHE